LDAKNGLTGAKFDLARPILVSKADQVYFFCDRHYECMLGFVAVHFKFLT